MKIITLRNDFHQTSARVRVELVSTIDIRTDLPVLAFTLTDSQSARVGRKLCGIAGCTCGGIRGRQEHKGVQLLPSRYF